MILRNIGTVTSNILTALESQFGSKYLYSFNSFMPNETWAEDSLKISLEQKKDIMAIETPLIGRTDFKNIKQPIEYYFRIGINYVSSFFITTILFQKQRPSNVYLICLTKQTQC